MKKQNQIRKDTNPPRKSAQSKTGKTRVRLRVPAPLNRAIRAKAKRENISISRLVERAIREVLPLVEGTIAETSKASAAESYISKNWEEVAYIDYSGYLDRDCNERIIYKTPEGTLKAEASFSNGSKVFENVTREEVARWIHECSLPEEFKADFSLSRSVNGTTLKAQDALENAVLRGAALLEAFAALLELSEAAEHPRLSDSAVKGLQYIAMEQGTDIHSQFENYTELVRRGEKVIAA